MQTFSSFFKVIAQTRTYLSIFYLLLAFPLGIFYFVFLVTGLSLGAGLIITLFGIPVLLTTLFLWRMFAFFEIQLAKIVLDIDIQPTPMKQSKGLWGKLQPYLVDPFTWKSLVYLFLKFPLGIASFIILIVAISVSFAFIATPFIFHLQNIGAISGNFEVGQFSFMRSYWFTITTGIAGLLLLFVSLHIFNGLALVYGLLAKFMLEKKK